MPIVKLGEVAREYFVPDIIVQKQFAAFVRQTDKSKFALQLTGSNLNLSRCLGISKAIQ